MMRVLYIQMKKISWKIVIFLYIIQIILFQIMNHFTFPVIQEHLGELKMFDMMKQGYDLEIATSILQTIGEQGRFVYLFRQMPIDFIYPVVMGTVYYLVLVKTSAKFHYCYFILPILLIFCDWLENCCIIFMLTGHPLSAMMVRCSSCLTQLKVLLGDYLLYFIAIISLAIYGIRILREHCNQKK